MLIKTVLASTLIITILSKSANSEINPNQDWWKNAVVYQIYPRSFMDSNNDGIGDLNGIISRLDHLVDAGVTALWLSPIYKSPQVDHGYDISDYRDIDGIFGNLTDFRNLVSLAKQKGLKVILDFVPNHSSDKHEWFAKSENREPGYENYYVWKDGSPNNKPPNNWISTFHGPAWTYSKIRKQWYLHQFASGQPDLNYRNPKVVEEMKDILVYWMDIGVDGFRIDVVTALFEDESFPDEPLSNIPNFTPDDYEYLEHIYTVDQPENFDMCYQWRELLNKYSEEKGGDVRIMMTEAYSPDDKLFRYYGNETHDGAHFSFNFWFITELNRSSNAHQMKSVIDRFMNLLPKRYVANWVLGNHDQHRVASRYGPERLDSLNMLAMVLPGVAVTYNGEEIGMENGEVTWKEGEDPQACNGKEENFDRDSRDFQRTPFHWDDSVNAGFNKGGKPWLPVSKKYISNNLAAQKISEVKSHYKIYQDLIEARKSETLKYGTLSTSTVNENVLVVTRELEGHPVYILIINIGDKTETVDLSSNYLKALPERLTIKISSVQSQNMKGTLVSSKAVTLSAFEGILLTSE